MDKNSKTLCKCITSNTSAIWQQTANTIYKPSSLSCSTKKTYYTSSFVTFGLEHTCQPILISKSSDYQTTVHPPPRSCVYARYLDAAMYPTDTETDFASLPGAPFLSGLVVQGKGRKKHKQPTQPSFRTTRLLLPCATKLPGKKLWSCRHTQNIVLYTYLEFHLYQDP